jgi:hypothetical protein
MPILVMGLPFVTGHRANMPMSDSVVAGRPSLSKIDTCDAWVDGKTTEVQWELTSLCGWCAVRWRGTTEDSGQ